MITWVVETGIETEYELRLITSARKAGCEVHSLNFLPFDGGTRQFIPEMEGRVVFHG